MPGNISILDALRDRWMRAFGTDPLPPDATLAYWTQRYTAEILDSAFRATVKRSIKLGKEMSFEHRVRFFSSVASRLKLSQLEQETDARVKAVAMIWERETSVSDSTTAENVERALDLMEVLFQQGLPAFWERWFADTDSSTRKQAEDLLRRFGPNMTFGDMKHAVKGVLNTQPE